MNAVAFISGTTKIFTKLNRPVDSDSANRDITLHDNRVIPYRVIKYADNAINDPNRLGNHFLDARTLNDVYVGDGAKICNGAQTTFSNPRLRVTFTRRIIPNSTRV